MPVRTSEKDDTLLVHLEDRVSIEDTLQFGQVMQQALGEVWSTIVVVVTSKVVNSQCLGTLLASHREAEKGGKILKVVCEQPLARASIQRFDPRQYLRLFRSVQEAVSEAQD